MQFLLLLDGMTGAGKTTVSHILARQLPRTAIIGMDRVKRFISDFERGYRDNAIARSIVFEMTKKYLELGLSVIVDQPYNDEEEINHYKELAEKYSIPYHAFQLFVDPGIAYSRITERQKDKEDKISNERILRNISLFQKREGFIGIDTSVLPQEAVAEVILKSIQ